MRFDLLTIFPSYFAPLELSLIGKAQQSGALEIAVHDLRSWASGPHLAVDDTPSGGGAGMVMRADVWGEAIDAVRQPRSTRTILAIPTPGGIPLTPRIFEDLTSAEQIIVACGRYEGIDARVAEHYQRTDLEVLEFSLGDYILNGGEVAALVLVEGVSRLLDGFMGNPSSVVEESHSDEGLLEYPVFTRPRSWRNRRIPEVLYSGDHQRIARWRRDQALVKTLRVRPDLIDRHIRLKGKGSFDSRDREVLAQSGLILLPKRAEVEFEICPPSRIAEVADLAARTFPLACPPGTSDAEIEDFVSTNLTEGALTRSVMVEGARICIAIIDSEIVGYTLLLPAPPGGLERDPGPSLYVSKCYVDEGWHGSGLSGALLEFAIADGKSVWDSRSAVLGTNTRNQRATRFYRRHGFTKSGTRTFEVGGRKHHDFVFVRDLTGE